MTFSMQNGIASGKTLANDYRPTSVGVVHSVQAGNEGGSRSVHPERNVLDKFVGEIQIYRGMFMCNH